MTDLHVGPIKDFALGIFDGPHATPPESDEGPIFLGIKNVTSQGVLDLSTIRHVSEQEYAKWTRRVVPEENDIVFSYEATLHLYALIPEGFRGCLGRRMALVRPDPKKVHPRFLHYYFLTPRWREVVERSVINGATVDRIPLKRFPEFEIRVPKLRVQERIASILSAYDDLIENNRRRIQLLEQSARLLYKEWFVNLRFPGHEHVKVKDGVPEGWQRKRLVDCVTFRSGGTPSKSRSEFWSGDIPWMSSGELTAIRLCTAKHHVTEGAVLAGSRFAEVGTILGVVRGMSLAKEFRLGIVAKRMCFNQDVKAFVPDRGIESLYIFHALDEQRDRIRQQAGEASHGTKKLETTVMENLSLTVPTDSIRKLFLEHAAALHAQMDALIQQTRRLEQVRDLLLPRVMSGEITI